MLQPMQDGYSGTENLEVMAGAVRYNAYLLNLVCKHLPEGPSPVMDFGAGSGTFALPLRNRGWPITCVEPDADLRHRLEQHGLATARTVSLLPARSFALVYSLNVLEHIRDDLATLVELREYLADGGVLLLYVPAFQSLYSSMDRKVGHFRRYRRAGLTALLRQAGYVVEMARYVDCLGYVAGLLYRLIGRDDGTIDKRPLALYDRWVFPLSVHLDRLVGRWLGKNLVVVARVSRHA